jgi:capsular polysaccharide transport system permease protein
MVNPKIGRPIFAVVRSLSLIVGVPTLLAMIYYGFFASDIYISEVRFAIRGPQSTPQTGELALMLGGVSIGGGSIQDAVVVSDYIHSRKMLDQLQRLGLRAHYSSAEVDWLSRLSADTSKEEFLKYFKDKVEVLRDETSNIITLKTKAFSSEMAKRMAELIIRLSEDLVNRMSRRIEEDAISFARKELKRATEKVHAATQALTRFRNEHESIDPAEKTTAVLGIVTGIEQRLAEARAELSEARGYMREDSAAVKALQYRVVALTKQLDIEQSRLAGKQGEHLSGLIEDYQPLVLEQELAREYYTSALASLENARLEAQRKQRYLITFIPPTEPDEAVEPKRVWKILTVMVGALLIYVIGGLMWAALKDHMGHA